ncbi:DUF2252 domain-containing protein [Microbacterium sp.]|uniref:DUF2252 domain-containing protein n=1 Tax=Microbacterium sp. TaxID=51671 RepID=UPI0039E2D285
MNSIDPSSPPSRAAQREAGRAARAAAPRRALAELPTGGRDPLGILDAQNATRVPELVPLRVERMAASPFAFYRGTAALMAADLGRGESSGIPVASCGDAHVSNFGFYASPQRTLVFDLNDFDEAAWAPWEWDVKRLTTSIIVAGQATDRDPAIVRAAAKDAVTVYARALDAGSQRSAVARYYEHFDAEGTMATADPQSRKVLKAAIKEATRRTGERAASKLTAIGDDGRLRFVEQPPTMTHVEPDVQERITDAVQQYLASAAVDVRLVVSQHVPADTARRVVGVGSVGTRCYVTVFQDGDGRALLLQSKEAGRSVLAEYGGWPQPPELEQIIDAGGEGARVVALQRVLQGVSDPFLGHMRERYDFYVRQFRDMKGGIEVERLDDAPFRRYAQACGAVLARAHSQSPHAARVVGYVGGGREVRDAIVDWSYAYADLSRADYRAFLAQHGRA